MEQEYDRITYGRLGKIAKEHPELVEEIPFFDVWSQKTDEAGENPWYKDLVPGFTVLHDKKSNTQGIAIPGNFSKGTTFKSYITNAPNYLAWLSQECNKRGIPMVRHRLSALDQAYDLYALGLSKEKGKTVDLVINCSALGARSLIGVEDQSRSNSRYHFFQLILGLYSCLPRQGPDRPRQGTWRQNMLHAFRIQAQRKKRCVYHSPWFPASHTDFTAWRRQTHTAYIHHSAARLG